MSWCASSLRARLRMYTADSGRRSSSWRCGFGRSNSRRCGMSTPRVAPTGGAGCRSQNGYLPTFEDGQTASLCLTQRRRCHLGYFSAGADPTPLVKGRTAEQGDETDKAHRLIGLRGLCSLSPVLDDGRKLTPVREEERMEDPDEETGYSEPSVAEKIMLALKGDRETRMKLVRDINRPVWAAVLCSPQTNELDVERISEMREVQPDVLREIGKKREWLRRNKLCVNLVMNPVTPEDIAINLLSRLAQDDLARVAANLELSPTIRRVAEELRGAR